MPAAETQRCLREGFARWGKPARMRVDNGSPWGSAGDLPTELALWLFGLGVAVKWNPPLRPEDNGVVERSQGTGKRWCEPLTCADAAELQRRVDDMDEIQRAEYPSKGGKSRMEAFPSLRHSGRPYRVEDEAATWSHEAALAHLATYVVMREVDARGSISLGNRSRYVGVQFSKERVYVSLDPQEMQWMIRDRKGTNHVRLSAEELSPERITGLDVSRHRSRPPRPPRSARRTGMSRFPADHGVQ